MPRRPRATSLRPLPPTRATWGAALLAAPGACAAALGGHPDDHRERLVLRVLGLRHLVQAVTSTARPRPAVALAGAGVDLVHCASGVALSVVSPRYARVALTDAVVAAGWAAASCADARQLALGRRRITPGG